MKNCGRRNVRKHKEIMGSEKYVTLEISSKFDSLEKMKITSSESKVQFGKIRKGVDYLSGFQDQSKAIGNVSEKDISRIIKDFEKIEKLPYEKKRPKHEPTDSYFHLAKQLAKCMMRSDKLNW